MKCPKCNSDSLKKSTPNSHDICERCGGMWLLNIEKSDLISIPVGEVNAEADSKDHDIKTGICPSGHGIMIRAKVDIDEPFYLERCTICGGIWFDKGEWLRIAKSHLADSLSNIWSKSWQRKQSKDKDRKSFMKTNQKLLGEQIFNSIIELAESLKNHPEKHRTIALLQQEIE